MADALPLPTKFVPFPIVTHNQRTVLGVAIVFSILPAVAVTLRLVARRISKRALDASDYCIVAACVFVVALECVSITAVFKCGIGYDHMIDVMLEYGPEPITDLFKLLIPLQFLWALSLAFSKISILLLYSAVFAVPVVIWTTRSVIVFIAAWALATILAGCLICSLNLITDILVLVLPLPYLVRLQMRLYKKLVLLAVFSIGLVTCIVSAIRIHTLKSMDFNDITYSLPPANIFSGLEPSVAVTLACVPLLRPLLGCSKYSSNGTGGYASGSGTPSKALEIEAGDSRPFEPLTDDSSQYRLRPLGPNHHAEIQSTAKSANSRSSSDLELDGPEGILVRSQWKVASNNPRPERQHLTEG